MTEHSSYQPANRPLFEACLRPHRSMNEQQVRRLMILISVMASATAVPFFLMGAWPIVGFMGLDVLLLYIAFRASFRSASAYELIRLDPLMLDVEKVSSDGRRKAFKFNPRWVRLHAEEDEDFGMRRLCLQMRMQEIELGKFLAPNERADFVKAFRPALAQARRGPVFDHDQR